MITTVEELKDHLKDLLKKEQYFYDDFGGFLLLNLSTALCDIEKVATAIAKIEVLSEHISLLNEVKSSDGILLQQWAEGACDVLEKELAREAKNFPQSPSSSSRLIAKMWLRNVFVPLCGRGQLDKVCIFSNEKCNELAHLLVECRDALPAISITSARLHNVDLGLAQRIENALKPWEVT
jgi:hypothetical protein